MANEHAREMGKRRWAQAQMVEVTCEICGKPDHTKRPDLYIGHPRCRQQQHRQRRRRPDPEHGHDAYTPEGGTS